MKYGNRLKEARKRKGLSQEQLAKKSGVGQGSISKIERGDQDSSAYDIELALALDVSPLWLKKGIGKVDVAPPFTVKKTEAADVGDDSVVINQYHDVHGAMGEGLTLPDQNGQITGISVDKEWITKNVPANTGTHNLRIVTGFGDSMKGMFNSGDPLLIDSGVKDIKYDGVYFFRVGDEGFIKRLQRIPSNGIIVISSNKEYRDWTITGDMDFEVFGRVLKVWNGSEM
jgi:Predicted transcriptional regulator